MRYKIAEIAVDIEGFCPESVLERMEAYRLDGPAPGDALRVECSVADRIPALELEEIYGVRHFINEFGPCRGALISQDRDGTVSYATLAFDADFRRVRCTLTDVEAAGGERLDVRMGVALGDCVRYSLPAYGGVTFHASAIAYKGAALLFAAPSGTGKSTQARLWKEAFPEAVEYINDDTPILRAEGGVCRAYGSPWAGTSGINNNVSAPVRAIVYVTRASDNSIRPLVGREKLLRALRSVRKQYFPAQVRRQTEILFAALANVPVYELRCDISRGAVETVKSLLF